MQWLLAEHENDKTIYGRKRKWQKPLKFVIFGAKNENEFRSAFNHDASDSPATHGAI